ncbi:MAG: DNA polymerase I [Synechococcales cyanobacterium]
MDTPLPGLLLIDGHSLAYRAYYAFAYSRDGGLRTSTGIPTSVCFGFLKVLLEVLERFPSSHLAVAFDTREPTFRHEIDDTYKAGRPETPEDFIVDIQNLFGLLQALGIPILTAPGYEADDVLGTLTHVGKEQFPVQILSGDQDLFQLIDDTDRVTVLHLNSKDKITPFHAAEVKAKLGVWPWQVVDYKALCGDSSDNIPGVRGIGAKRAVDLLTQFENLEQILAAIPTLKGAIQKALQEGVAAARHSQFMARIRCDVPLSVDWQGMALQGFAIEDVIPLFRQLEFHSLISQVEHIHQRLGGEALLSGTKGAGSAGEYASQTTTEDGDLWFDFATQGDPVRASVPLAQSPTLPLVEIIETPEQLTTLRDTLLALTTPVAWDTETTSLNPRQAELIGLSCCWDPEHVAYLPVDLLGWETIRAAFQDYWRDPLRPKILQNGKYDQAVLRAQGAELHGVVFDPMIASYVLDPEGNHGLKDLAQRYLHLEMVRYEDLVPKKGSLRDVPLAKVAAYCGADAWATYQLTPLLQAALAEHPRLWALFREVELPLSQILLDMEWTGIGIDCAFLAEFSQQLAAELAEVEVRVHALAGEAFNLNSPKQLGTTLFEKLGLPIQKTRKTSSGYSTDAAVLEKLLPDHPVIASLLHYRTLSKLKSTYVDALPTLVNPTTGRVHTDFNQTVTATGRLSSSHPNLQNIPIRTAFSRRIRQAFIPQTGWLLVSADYSQIELRILAHLSQEPTLVAGFQNGEDVHTLTAQLLLNKTEISTDERRLAKTINYGVIYGMGAQRFAQSAGVSYAEAKSFITKFNQQYRQVFDYMKSVEEQAEQQGYVETILGRRRYFPSLRTLTGFRKQAELRAAVNAPIQGSASDLIKLAMVHLMPLLRPQECHLLLQVHDELVLEVDPQVWPQVEPQIRQAMEGALSLSVPLSVDIQSGQNWQEAK